MRLRLIHIDGFGKFNDFDLNLVDGLNIIFGENESGKSTLMNFILMTFYGTSQNKRKKDISNNLRLKYKPWNQKEMKGYIIFDFEGIEYRLERTFGPTNKKDIVNLMDNNTGVKIPLENPQAPGEYFFGMSLESFDKSLFIDSEDLDISSSNTTDISQRLRNIISTSDEEVSIESSIQILEDKLYSLRSKRGDKGLLVEGEMELEELRKSLIQAKEDERNKLAIQQELLELESALEIEKLREKHDRYELQIENTKALSNKNDERKVLEKRLEEYEDKKNILTGLLRANEMKIEDTQSMIQEDQKAKSKVLGEMDDLDNKINLIDKEAFRNDKRLRFASFGFLFPAIAFALLTIFLLTQDAHIIAITCIGLISIGFFAAYYYSTKSIDRKVVDEYASQDTKDLLKEKKNEYRLILEGLDNLERKKQELKLESKEYKLELENLEEKNKDKKDALDSIIKNKFFLSVDPRILENSKTEIERIKTKIDLMTKQHLDKFGKYDYLDDNHLEEDRHLFISNKYERRKAYALERFKNTRYVDEIAARIVNQEKVIEEYKKEYEATQIAIDTLNESGGLLMRDFTPSLNRKTQEVFSRLTGGRYEKVKVASDFAISFEDKDRKEIKDWAFLSSGAKDQAYISLKIALALLINKMKDPILLLDDIFVKFDEGRAKEGVDFLLDLQKDFSQIVLFTCHKRIVSMAQDSTNKIYL